MYRTIKDLKMHRWKLFEDDAEIIVNRRLTPGRENSWRNFWHWKISKKESVHLTLKKYTDIGLQSKRNK